MNQKVVPNNTVLSKAFLGGFSLGGVDIGKGDCVQVKKLIFVFYVMR